MNLRDHFYQLNKTQVKITVDVNTGNTIIEFILFLSLLIVTGDPAFVTVIAFEALK